MIYLPEDYHSYKYLVECNDNYFILSKANHVYGESGDPATINVIYQYINPSIITIPSTYTTESTRSFTDVSSSFSSSVFDRADFPNIFICSVFILFIFGFILNQLSKLVYKGGLFGSN